MNVTPLHGRTDCTFSHLFLLFNLNKYMWKIDWCLFEIYWLTDHQLLYIQVFQIPKFEQHIYMNFYTWILVITYCNMAGCCKVCLVRALSHSKGVGCLNCHLRKRLDRKCHLKLNPGRKNPSSHCLLKLSAAEDHGKCSAE